MSTLLNREKGNGQIVISVRVSHPACARQVSAEACGRLHYTAHPCHGLLFKLRFGSLLLNFPLSHRGFSGTASAVETSTAVTPCCGPGAYAQPQKSISDLESRGFAEGSPQLSAALSLSLSDVASLYPFPFRCEFSLPKRQTLISFHPRSTSVPWAFSCHLCRTCALAMPFVPASPPEA